MTSDTRSDLTRAAALAAASPKMIASLFAPWERAFVQKPADHLGADQRSMSRLALCVRPDSDRFAADVAEIAVACEIDEGRLLSFLRQAVSVERMASASPVGDALDGRLMAARDRDEDPE